MRELFQAGKERRMNGEHLTEGARTMDSERKAYLSKWLRSLFFWSLVAMVGRGALIYERLLARIYKTYHLYLDFSIIGVTVLATIAMAWVFWKLGKESTCYYCVVFLLAISFCVEVLLFEKGAAGPLWWGLRLLETGAALANAYHRYQGHAEILEGVSNELAHRWSVLWKWMVRLIAAGVAGLLVGVLLSSDLGAILVLAALVGVAVIGILELVYLWQTGSAVQSCTLKGHEFLPEAETL